MQAMTRNGKRRNMQMKILIVGGGGREHAIAWKLAKSPKVEKFIVHRAMQALPRWQSVSISVSWSLTSWWHLQKNMPSI